MRDKQIEEMARDICHLPRTCDECEAGAINGYRCQSKKYAERAVDKGYRKASDIFEEIENNYADFLYDGYRNIVVLTEKDFEELKMKYLGEDINAPTKESEGEG